MEFKLKQTLKDGKTFDYELVEGGSVVGVAQLRIEPSKGASLPKGFESHMYYEIWPQFQKKGYGRKLFKLCMDRLFELGVKEPIVTVLDTNIPSKKIVESAGGILLEQGLTTKGELMDKYVFRNKKNR